MPDSESVANIERILTIVLRHRFNHPRRTDVASIQARHRQIAVRFVRKFELLQNFHLNFRLKFGASLLNPFAFSLCGMKRLFLRGNFNTLQLDAHRRRHSRLIRRFGNRFA